MIANAKAWATSRNLVRRNEVHKAEEFKIPTSSSFAFTETNRKTEEKSGSFEVEDPDGTLLTSDALSAEAAIMRLVR